MVSLVFVGWSAGTSYSQVPNPIFPLSLTDHNYVVFEDVKSENNLWHQINPPPQKKVSFLFFVFNHLIVV